MKLYKALVYCRIMGIQIDLLNINIDDTMADNGLIWFNGEWITDNTDKRSLTSYAKIFVNGFSPDVFVNGVKVERGYFIQFNEEKGKVRLYAKSYLSLFNAFCKWVDVF